MKHTATQQKGKKNGGGADEELRECPLGTTTGLLPHPTAATMTMHTCPSRGPSKHVYTALLSGKNQIKPAFRNIAFKIGKVQIGDNSRTSLAGSSLPAPLLPSFYLWDWMKKNPCLEPCLH